MQNKPLKKKMDSAYQIISEKYPSKSFVYIKNAHQHNLKNVDVVFPKEKFVVVTGPSGSGKSSLVMDTLYAEGRRKYAESLSAYIRQFLGKIEKPRVDFIHGLAPAIALEQKTISGNPRSTVGTVTEIYDYLKLFFLRVGKIYHPRTGKEIKRNTLSDVVRYIFSVPPGKKIFILSPAYPVMEKHPDQWWEMICAQGITKIFHDNNVLDVDQTNPSQLSKKKEIYLVIDRLMIPQDAEKNDEFLSRIEDSISVAFREGEGKCAVFDGDTIQSFSRRLELDGLSMPEPDLAFFSYNHPLGACSACEGFGTILGIDPEKIFPDRNLSVYDDAIACWRGQVYQWYKHQLIKNAWKFDFPVHTPVKKLTEQQYKLLWDGNEYFTGIRGFFKELEKELYKIQNRVFISRFRGRTVCVECEGARLHPRTDVVKVHGRNLRSLMLDEVQNVLLFFKNISLTPEEKNIAAILLREIISRLEFLVHVGLGYLTLHRSMNTLSGGESQRVHLATQLGSSLCGSLYILDEPSVGLHPKDTQNLIHVLKELRNQGNTVVVVEHDEQIIRSADWLIDLGPGAGQAGGNLLYNGTLKEAFLVSNISGTIQYLKRDKHTSEKNKIPRPWSTILTFFPSSRNNLKISRQEIPLHVLTVVCGVSGSGKSTLILDELAPALETYISSGKKSLPGKLILPDGAIDFIEVMNQSPIGKSSRSSAITYLKVFDLIRMLYAQHSVPSNRKLTPSYFSLNVDGGRCDVCKGEGSITVEMQFMADVKIPCEACGGLRYKEEALAYTFEGYTISGLLDLTIEEAYRFFSVHSLPLAKKICQGIKPLLDVGLGYLKMGQSSTTYSGGEAQRVKLAFYLSAGSKNGKGLFVFDEPTTGLHFKDVEKLLSSLDLLIGLGHTIILIEHHPDVIRHADWIIELGPEGGKNGGRIIFSGTPDNILSHPHSVTGKFL